MASGHETHEDTGRTTQPPRNTVALGTGFIIGILWVIMGVVSLVSAARGYANHRYDWGLAWGLIGLLITAAGSISMIATWWHLTRVRDDH
jgi:uncharacterized membrane protein HdeD (DUF308 family)